MFHLSPWLLGPANNYYSKLILYWQLRERRHVQIRVVPTSSCTEHEEKSKVSMGFETVASVMCYQCNALPNCKIFHIFHFKPTNPLRKLSPAVSRDQKVLLLIHSFLLTSWQEHWIFIANFMILRRWGSLMEYSLQLMQMFFQVVTLWGKRLHEKPREHLR